VKKVELDLSKAASPACFLPWMLMQNTVILTLSYGAAMVYFITMVSCEFLALSTSRSGPRVRRLEYRHGRELTSMPQ
jgi:hypothetical protein